MSTITSAGISDEMIVGSSIEACSLGLMAISKLRPLCCGSVFAGNSSTLVSRGEERRVVERGLDLFEPASLKRLEGRDNIEDAEGDGR